MLERERQIPTPAIKPYGRLAAFFQERGYLGGLSLEEKMERQKRRIQALTQGGFNFGISVVVPEVIESEIAPVQPMIFINELSYGVPTHKLEEIKELIIFEDKDLIDWLINTATLKEKVSDPTACWIFPGGGGRYMKEELAKRGIRPTNFIEIGAKRQWTSKGEVWCRVDLPLGDNEIERKLSQANSLVFIDDTVCTGSTLAEIVHSLEFYYNWQPESGLVGVEALSFPRKKEMFAWTISEGNWQVYSSIFYGGETKRPRLLTTGSIIRGINEPERFSQKRYPAELINKVRETID